MRHDYSLVFAASAMKLAGLGMRPNLSRPGMSQAQAASELHRFTPYGHLISLDKVGIADAEVDWTGTPHIIWVGPLLFQYRYFLVGERLKG